MAKESLQKSHNSNNTMQCDPVHLAPSAHLGRNPHVADRLIQPLLTPLGVAVKACLSNAGDGDHPEASVTENTTLELSFCSKSF